MKPVWAAQMDRTHAATLRVVRTIEGIRVGEAGEAVWLCGESLNDPLSLALRKIPGAIRFTVLSDGQLLPQGARVPRGRLPALQWVAIRDWVRLNPQPAALSGEPPVAVPLRLVRVAGDGAPTILLTDWATFSWFAVRAPELRLQPLHFACAADGRVVLRGTPLPALPGARFVEQSGVGVPCGYAVVPSVEPGVLHQLFELSRGDLVLLDPVGGFERIVASSFVAATRSAVRMTHEVNVP
jgi:hypothetical protein